MLTGQGGNVGVSIGADATFVVDDQYAPMVPKLIAAIGALTSRPVRFVFNTHYHGDHTGGNEELGRAGALLVAHANTRQRMSSEQLVEFFNAQVPPSPAGALPVVTFSDTVTFHINGDDVIAFHVDPAHTDGDAIVVWRNANVVHMGDVYIAAGYPFTDFGSGGNINGVVAAADRVLAIANADTRIIPGHGQLSNTAELRAWRDMIVTVRERVRALQAAGRTLEEVIAARPSAEFDGTYGGGFIKPDDFVGFVYRSLP
jgi:glyoxylase-like metal-dependent hydrolase (beta-lactamase superfamily II)